MKVIDSISPAPRDAWEEALRADPLALETQSPAWIDAMCAAGGFEDASRLYETEEGGYSSFPSCGAGWGEPRCWKLQTRPTAGSAGPRVLPAHATGRCSLGEGPARGPLACQAPTQASGPL